MAWPQNEVKVEGSIDEGSTICVFTFLNFNPRTLNFERKYWEQLSCTINIFIKPRFYRSCDVGPSPPLSTLIKIIRQHFTSVITFITIKSIVLTATVISNTNLSILPYFLKYLLLDCKKEPYKKYKLLCLTFGK